MNKRDMAFVDKADMAWGVELPVWVMKLAERCDEVSQNKVGKTLGISGSQISQIINRQYKGVYANAADLVKSHLMSENVECPAFDRTMTLARCLENQMRLEENLMSGTERRFFVNACPKCPNFKHK